MEMVQSLRVALVNGPGLAAVEQRGKHHGSVDFDFGIRGDASSVPHVLVESAKSGARLCESGVHLVINDDVPRQLQQNQDNYLKTF